MVFTDTHGAGSTAVKAVPGLLHLDRSVFPVSMAAKKPEEVWAAGSAGRISEESTSGAEAGAGMGICPGRRKAMALPPASTWTGTDQACPLPDWPPMVTTVTCHRLGSDGETVAS